MHEALDYVKAATPAAVGSSAEPPGVPTLVAPILLSHPANRQCIVRVREWVSEKDMAPDAAPTRIQSE